MENSAPLTVGDELKNYLENQVPKAVLELTMAQAYSISQEGAPWPNGFTQEDANILDNLYALYASVSSHSGNTAPYWRKPS